MSNTEGLSDQSKVTLELSPLHSNTAWSPWVDGDALDPGLLAVQSFVAAQSYKTALLADSATSDSAALVSPNGEIGNVVTPPQATGAERFAVRGSYVRTWGIDGLPPADATMAKLQHTEDVLRSTRLTLAGSHTDLATLSSVIMFTRQGGRIITDAPLADPTELAPNAPQDLVTVLEKNPAALRQIIERPPAAGSFWHRVVQKTCAPANSEQSGKPSLSEVSRLLHGFREKVEYIEARGVDAFVGLFVLTDEEVARLSPKVAKDLQRQSERYASTILAALRGAYARDGASGFESSFRARIKDYNNDYRDRQNMTSRQPGEEGGPLVYSPTTDLREEYLAAFMHVRGKQPVRSESSAVRAVAKGVEDDLAGSLGLDASVMAASNDVPPDGWQVVELIERRIARAKAEEVERLSRQGDAYTTAQVGLGPMSEALLDLYALRIATEITITMRAGKGREEIGSLLLGVVDILGQQYDRAHTTLRRGELFIEPEGLTNEWLEARLGMDAVVWQALNTMREPAAAAKYVAAAISRYQKIANQGRESRNVGNATGLMHREEVIGMGPHALGRLLDESSLVVGVDRDGLQYRDAGAADLRTDYETMHAAIVTDPAGLIRGEREYLQAKLAAEGRGRLLPWQDRVLCVFGSTWPSDHGSQELLARLVASGERSMDVVLTELAASGQISVIDTIGDLTPTADPAVRHALERISGGRTRIGEPLPYLQSGLQWRHIYVIGQATSANIDPRYPEESLLPYIPYGQGATINIGYNQLLVENIIRAIDPQAIDPDATTHGLSTLGQFRGIIVPTRIVRVVDKQAGRLLIEFNRQDQAVKRVVGNDYCLYLYRNNEDGTPAREYLRIARRLQTIGGASELASID